MSDTSDSNSCLTCTYVFDAGEEGRTVYECRRFPPTTTSTSGQAAFPAVGADDWCGEFVVGTAPPVATDAPVIVDVPYASQDGVTLSCTMGNWENEPTSYAYRWILDGTEILGLGPTYEVPNDPAVIGHDATCIVTASNAVGDTDSPPSNVVVIAGPAAGTAAVLTGGTFDDAGLATLVTNIAAKGSAWAGFDIVVDAAASHSVRQQFGTVVQASDICALINAQLGEYATTSLAGTAAPWCFQITSNWVGAESQLDYPTVPITYNDVDPLKRTEDISVMMRLTAVTGAVIVQGSDTAGVRAPPKSPVPAIPPRPRRRW